MSNWTSAITKRLCQCLTYPEGALTLSQFVNGWQWRRHHIHGRTGVMCHGRFHYRILRVWQYTTQSGAAAVTIVSISITSVYVAVNVAWLGWIENVNVTEGRDGTGLILSLNLTVVTTLQWTTSICTTHIKPTLQRHHITIKYRHLINISLPFAEIPQIANAVKWLEFELKNCTYSGLL